MSEIEYDPYGRMKYHPEIHFNQGKPWLVTDEKYLIEHYEKVGPEEVSFSLGRTIHEKKAGCLSARQTQCTAG